MCASARNPEAILKRLEWTVIRRLDGLLQGDYRTLFRGFGLDLADLREYQYQDDVRSIDWNVTARLQTPYVRQYNEDREISAWFLLDLSPSVDFGTVDGGSVIVRKRNMLVDFVTVIARLLTRGGNRTGGIFYGGKVEEVIPPRGGRQHVLYLLHSLLSQPELSRTPPTDLNELFETALRLVRKRSLIFVISDFLSAPGWAASLALLNTRHEVLAIRLLDPLELELPDVGMIVMQDAETGEQLFVDTHDRGFRKRFSRAVAQREEELRSLFRQAGVEELTLSTGDDIVDSIVRFAALRKQRSLTPAANPLHSSRRKI